MKRSRGPAPLPRIEADAEAPLALALDTSSSVDAIALAQGDLVLASRWVRRPRRRGSALAARISELLESVGRRTEDLSALAVVTAPAAFTGLRVGIATAQGLAAGLGIPSYAYDSTPGWAASAPACRCPVAVTLDARRSEVYTALYEVDADGVGTVLEPVSIQSPEQWFSLLEQRSEELLLVGDGARLYRDMARERLGELARIPSRAGMAPDLGPLALEAVRRSGLGQPGEVLSPLYLRGVDGAKSNP